jgi:hypothetical protein
MTLQSQTVPKHGVELVALDLLMHDRNQRRRDIKPKYFIAVYSNVFKAATNLVHSMGYGSTPSHVETIVQTAYNEHDGDIYAAWPVLAERLREVSWVANGRMPQGAR